MEKNSDATSEGWNIVMADDDFDDRLLTLKAFELNQFTQPITTVEDGQELMDYLLGHGKYTSPPLQIPGLILLDLNMPKMDGREALREIKQHPDLKKIPVVIFSTSQADEDVATTYNLGANSFISKPTAFDELVKAVGELGSYWFKLVRSPVTNVST